MLICPRCKSKNIEPYVGNISGVFRCKDCGYIGIMIETGWYEKFRWFFTSLNVLVIAGKNAEQNEEVVKIAKPNMLMLHTESPGSPFCVLWQQGKSKQKDVEEAAIFCAAFSKEFKKNQSIKVHAFLKKNVRKTKNLPTGTFNVSKIKQELIVKPKLSLVKQKNRFVIVPSETAKRSRLKVYATITKGDMTKQKQTIEKIANQLMKKLRIKDKLDKIIFLSLKQQITKILPARFSIRFR